MTMSIADRGYWNGGLAAVLGLVASPSGAGSAVAVPAAIASPPSPQTMHLTSTRPIRSVAGTAQAKTPAWHVGIGTSSPVARTGAGQ